MDTYTNDLNSKQNNSIKEKSLPDGGLVLISGLLWEAFRPLGPLAANLLWFSQPGFALFGKTELVDRLATLLDNPEGDQTGSGNKL
jgi:hypothetical protein